MGFDVNVLDFKILVCCRYFAIFGLKDWATFWKIGQFFLKSSGHPAKPCPQMLDLGGPMEVANTLAYYNLTTITAVKSFIVQAQDLKQWEHCPTGRYTYNQLNLIKYKKSIFDKI